MLGPLTPPARELRLDTFTPAPYLRTKSTWEMPARAGANWSAAVSSDDQVKAYIKKIMSQLDKWMVGGKISKLVIVITNKDTGEHVERWQFDVSFLSIPPLFIPILFPTPPNPNTQQTKTDSPPV